MATLTKLNSAQKEAFAALQKFLDHPAADTFVLKGYAGTGKTYLMQYLALWLAKNEKPFAMLASTGRAAAVLRGKTGFEARTVHGELYHFSSVEGDREDIQDDAPIDKFGQMTLQFELRGPDRAKKIYIIDEASMLASEKSAEDYFAQFGSGELLFDFFQAVNSNKVIFVGDPCQLPPVNHIQSPALDLSWLNESSRTPVSFELDIIERTHQDNDILILADQLRKMSEQGEVGKWPKIPARGKEHVKIYPNQLSLFKAYLNAYDENNLGCALAVAHSNRIVQNINRAFRRDKYHGLDKPLQLGEILLVTQNNYLVPLTNGDFVKVLSIGERRSKANLHFQDVRIISILSGQDYSVMLSLDILYGNVNNYTKEQYKALMVDFTKRMRQKGVRPNSEEYKMAMLKDDYLNSLKATYGYAVTCHKAQGGEWKDVYLFLDKAMYAMHRKTLCRWWYTAVTRAKENLHTNDDWWLV